MHRLRSLLTTARGLSPLALALHLLLAAPAPARAQQLDAGVCAPVERELASVRRALAEEHAATQSADREHAECSEELARTNEKVSQATASASTIKKDRDHLCSSTGSLVEDVARGQTRNMADTACVDPGQQARLDATLASWSSASAWLTQATAYGNGETDTPPAARYGTTALDRLLARASRSRLAFTQRRLLVEALQRIAPHAWAKLRAPGAGAVDAWFVSAEPLDGAIVEEAHHATRAATGGVSPPLTAALRLVEAFELTTCGNEALAPPECARAHALRQLLETSGALVLRRRVEQIWSTKCGEVAGNVLSWVDDFPTTRAANPEWTEVAKAASTKLFGCYLDDPTARASYGAWLEATLPPASTLTAAKLRHVDEIKAQLRDAPREVACTRAVRALQTMREPTACVAPAYLRTDVAPWATLASGAEEQASDALRTCGRYARLLWEGRSPSIASAFASPPSVDEAITLDKDAPPTPMARLREHCEQRRGSDAFPDDLRALGGVASGLGERVDVAPYRLDPATSLPLERARFDAAQSLRSWVANLTEGKKACGALGLTDERCRHCAEVPEGSAYDCRLVQRLETRWASRTRGLVATLLVVLGTLLLARWARRFREARASFGPWAQETTGHLEGIGLTIRRDRWRNLLPSRQDTLAIALPDDPAWERWGRHALVMRAPSGTRVLERDVNHAAFVARRTGATVVLLEHDDAASPDMSAIRAMLAWSAKGGSRAIQILPIGVTRAKWSKNAHDLLDLVEESSLRGDPFELRGRITISAQFFNRERLVSGLLASAQAGHWVVVTGLRRFGKSSLALEVARRLPGASAYVDLMGFDHEIGTLGDPLPAVDAILRFACLRLVESARERWPGSTLPDVPARGTELDAAALSVWFRELSQCCAAGSAGRAPPLLVVLDEIEQVLGVGPEKLSHVLDVLAIVVGRLKSAIGDHPGSVRGSPVSVFLASALHPLLWAPLRTLANQSIMGTFPRVCVPCLSEEAATSMMRSLGARQGIRFSDAALARIVDETQGVPLLLRRIGSSILELYDRERAREGSLGAVEIGVEGAVEAIEREAREGSTTRVWIETEIAPIRSPAGAILRCLAREDVVPTAVLRDLAKRFVAEDFVRTGIDRTLTPDETARRAEEAANVIIQLLDETGLLVPTGDLTAPDGYSLPQGAMRRVLAGQPSLSAFPSARPAP